MNIYQKLKKAGYMTDGLASPLKIDPPKGKKNVKKNGRLPEGVPKPKSGFESTIFKPGENKPLVTDMLYRLSPEEIALKKERKALEEKERKMLEKRITPF